MINLFFKIITNSASKCHNNTTRFFLQVLQLKATVNRRIYPNRSNKKL